MKRKCNKCGYTEKGSILDWLITTGLILGGSLWPKKPCPKCDGFLSPTKKKDTEKDKCNECDDS